MQGSGLNFVYCSFALRSIVEYIWVGGNARGMLTVYYSDTDCVKD